MMEDATVDRRENEDITERQGEENSKPGENQT